MEQGSWSADVDSIHLETCSGQVAIWLCPVSISWFWERSCLLTANVVASCRKWLCTKNQPHGTNCSYHISCFVQNKTCVHDSHLCHLYRGGHWRPYPTKRQTGPYNFIGAAGPMELKRECPENCRPENHKNWIYCWKVTIFYVKDYFHLWTSHKKLWIYPYPADFWYTWLWSTIYVNPKHRSWLCLKISFFNCV